MKTPSPLVVTLLIGLVAPAAARHWTTVVDPGLYQWVDFTDIPRLMASAPEDPWSSSRAPAAAPTSRPSEADANVEARTAPTALPSLAPTGRWEQVEQNGGCPTGQVMHELRLLDSWGDGWGETTLTITRLVDADDQPGVLRNEPSDDGGSTTTLSQIVSVRPPLSTDDPSFIQTVFEGSLVAGAEDFEYVCLAPESCYRVVVQGGLWPQEVSWGLRQVEMGVSRSDSPSDLFLTKGGAPEDCTLSVADAATGAQVCPVTCGQFRPTEAPTASPVGTTSAPSASGAPSDAPSLVPTWVGGLAGAGAGGSGMPSDAPSLVPTTVPTALQPKVKPSGLGGF
jgi:hypothetical protein